MSDLAEKLREILTIEPGDGPSARVKTLALNISNRAMLGPLRSIENDGGLRKREGRVLRARSDVDGESAEVLRSAGTVHLGAGARVRIPGVTGWLRTDWGIDPVDGASTISAAWVSGRSP